MLLHCLLDYIVSARKSAAVLIFVPLIFSSCSQDSFFLCHWFWGSLIMVCLWCTFLYFSCAWSSLSSWICKFIILAKFERLSAIISSNIFLFPSLSFHLGTLSTHMLGCWKVLLMLRFFFIILFSFLCFVLVSFHSYVSKFTNLFFSNVISAFRLIHYIFQTL